MITSDKVIVGPWVAKRINGTFTPETSQALGLIRQELVAGVLYENWNGASVAAHIAVEGLLTPGYLAAIFDYPFNVLGVRKIIAPIAESNTRSVNFVKKLGFRKEAQLLDAHPDGSLLLYTMTPGQCRFIGDKYGQRIKSASRA